jgi:hypothetical protein
MNSVPLGSQHTVEFTVSLPFSQHSPLTWRRLSLRHRMDGEGLETFTIHSLLGMVFLFLTFKGWLGRNLVFGYHVGITH